MATDQMFAGDHEEGHGALAGGQGGREMWHVSFRAFSSSGGLDPAGDLRRLRELCRRWLRPDLHTKEQILDMLVMEQFMISMPQELQVLVKESGVQSCKDLQDLLRSNQTPKKWIIVTIQGQECLVRSSDVLKADKKPQSSEASVRTDGGKTLRERPSIKNVHADTDTPSAHGSDKVSTPRGKRRDCQKTQRSPKRRKQEGTSISQDMATQLDKGEISGQPAASTPDRPVGDQAVGGTPNVCGLCKKEFRYKSQFSIHWRTHSGERPFKCNTCSGRFMQTSDLRVHQRIHTGEKPYCCEICLKTFTHDSTLRSHKRIHTNEQPYTCQECGKAFSHKGNLNVHRRTHTGAKPYTCSECNYAFRQLGSFKRHQKLHAKVTSQ
ncbi:putative zinc finger and SCAN domain-containing protein 5D [Suricata suricatta]|uniref:putative zinc finger and SCAN domain-containing protein 5D n=1 Tax=Suricata suricatta TaxID=37032 RepID=UPI0011559AAE|nr:putative zinc finger and SCAN domain-containing protein 5D [Suricata suricatta]